MNKNEIIESFVSDTKIQLYRTESWSFSIWYEYGWNNENITKNLKLLLHENDSELKEILDETSIELLIENKEDLNPSNFKNRIIPTFMVKYNSRYRIDDWLDDLEEQDKMTQELCFKVNYKEKEVWVNKWNKILLLLQWIPWSWKSTWIKENWLEQFVLSTDEYRMRFWTFELRLDWTTWISQISNKLVFQKIFEDLRVRMEKWLFTIIDATHNNLKSINQYKDYVETYWYSLYIKKFDISLEESIERNKLRWHKEVEKEVIEKMYNNLNELWRLNWIEYIEDIKELPNVSTEVCKLWDSYEKIYYIWDIQWCPRELQKFIDKHYNKNSLYIFTWDLVDRWYDDLWVLEIMYDFLHNDNVIMIKWNHDEYLERYLNQWWKWKTWWKTFDEVTADRIKDFPKEKLKFIVDKFVYSTFHEIWWKSIFACHWWVSKIVEWLQEKQLVRWVWEYDDHQVCDEMFNKWSQEETEKTWKQYYLVHWHRNSFNSHTKSTNRTFNLEWKIEFWWELRAVSFDKKWNNEIITIESSAEKVDWERKTLKERFEWNKFVHVKALNDWIYSVNFTREAFSWKIWDLQTIKARWLFIWENNEIYARSYEKFFNVWERNETKKEVVWNSIWFPIQVYHKYNWFLWIVWMKDWKVRYFSKSTDSWKFADLVRKHCSKYEDKLKYILKDWYTAVFEICDDTDVHIVKEKERAILLDIIKNDMNFEKKSYKELVLLSKAIWCEVKKSIRTLNNDQELQEFFKEIEDHKIEWYILEWTSWMTKTKSKHYLFWKEIRQSIRSIKKELNKNYNASEWLKTYDWENTYQVMSQEYADSLNDKFLNEFSFDKNKDFRVRHEQVIRKFQENKVKIFSKTIPELIEISKDYWISENPTILNDSENNE